MAMQSARFAPRTAVVAAAICACLLGLAATVTADPTETPGSGSPPPTEPAGFRLAVLPGRAQAGAEYVDPAVTTTVAVGEGFRIAPRLIDPANTVVSAGSVTDLHFEFVSTGGTPGAFVIDAVTGIISGQFSSAHAGATATITVRAIDAAGLAAVMEVFQLTAQFRDTEVAPNGPGGQKCANGIAVDSVAFDGAFKCDCKGTPFEGSNCQLATVAPASANTMCFWNSTQSACNVAIPTCSDADVAAITTCSLTHDGDEAACKADAACEWKFEQETNTYVCGVRPTAGLTTKCEQLSCGMLWHCRYAAPSSESECDTNDKNYGTADGVYGSWERSGCATDATSGSSVTATAAALLPVVGAIVTQLA